MIFHPVQSTSIFIDTTRKLKCIGITKILYAEIHRLSLT